ncbi:MAG: hypothetical protein DCC52_18435 [Chloroflexi bacterium]|nr:MAG: hypothetical protein DCC52_18435 [Chloroflexota bacterium]
MTVNGFENAREFDRSSASAASAALENAFYALGVENVFYALGVENVFYALGVIIRFYPCARGV